MIYNFLPIGAAFPGTSRSPDFPLEGFPRPIAVPPSQTEWLALMVLSGACSAPKPPDLPFRYRLPVKRRIPLIPLPPNPTGGFEPPALGI